MAYKTGRNHRQISYFYSNIVPKPYETNTVIACQIVKNANTDEKQAVPAS